MNLQLVNGILLGLILGIFPALILYLVARNREGAK